MFGFNMIDVLVWVWNRKSPPI